MMKLPLVLLLCSVSCHSLLLLLPVPAFSSPCDFPAVFNFGDSNSDTGGLSAAFTPVPPPYGDTYFKMPAGRYSDGRLIIDFIAESLGLPLLSAYLDSLGTNFSHGANFATAGSTITAQAGYSPFSLDVQLDQFSQFKSRSQSVYRKGGVFRDLMPEEEFFARALYTLDIGQNDLTVGYFLNKSTDITPALKEFSAVVKVVLNLFVTWWALQSIYEKGGRYFWIHNTGPLGCLPYVLIGVNLTAAQLDSVGCAIPHNELAQKFNQALNETVVQLRRDLPLAALTVVDVYSVKYSLISHAEKFRFEHPLKACCGYGGGKYNFDFSVPCWTTAVVNGTRVPHGKSCKDPSKRIVWDGVHYTEAANRWVFDRISEGAFSDPPNSLSMACQRTSL